MIIRVEIDDKTYARMMEGKRVEGTIGCDLWTGQKDFRAFVRKSREPGYVKPKPITLYETVTGRLNETAKTYNIYVSAKKSMGRKRCAEELQLQAEEMTDFLHLTKTIDEIINEV